MFLNMFFKKNCVFFRNLILFRFSFFNPVFFIFFLLLVLLLKSTLVADNDTTVHGVHTNTVAFSPSVLIKCSICSNHH